MHAWVFGNASMFLCRMPPPPNIACNTFLPAAECMYKLTTPSTKSIVDETGCPVATRRVASRPGEIPSEFRPLPMQNGLYIQRYATMLCASPCRTDDVLEAAEHARPKSVEVRQGIRALHDPENTTVQLAETRRRARLLADSRAVEIARHTDQRHNCIRTSPAIISPGSRATKWSSSARTAKGSANGLSFTRLAYSRGKFKIAVPGRRSTARDAGARNIGAHAVRIVCVGESVLACLGGGLGSTHRRTVIKARSLRARRCSTISTP